MKDAINSTKEILLAMMEQYDIGKKPLARLLGWGDTTVLRYLDGIEPNREFAARLKLLYENPWEYRKCLETGKDSITATAYEKSKKAVYRRLFPDKSTEAMQYVVTLAKGDIAPSRIMTVLLFAQVYSLLERGLPIFEEEVSVETKQSTPYPGLYERVMSLGIRICMPEQGALSKEDREYLEVVYQLLNGYSPNAIAALWKRDKRQLRRARERLRKEESVGWEELRDFYELMMQRLGTERPEQLKEYIAARLKGPGR